MTQPDRALRAPAACRVSRSVLPGHRQPSVAVVGVLILLFRLAGFVFVTARAAEAPGGSTPPAGLPPPAVWRPEGEGSRSAPLRSGFGLEAGPGSSLSAGFTWMDPAQTGVRFTNFLAEERHLTNQILLNGSGVAAGDVDGDGWCDLYFCGLDGPNRLYRNLGRWRFADITEAAGVGAAGLDATGAALADLDGDGDLDLVINTVGAGTRVFFNDGRGRFREDPASLNPRRGGTSLALADVDGDGDLDLYIANYRTLTIRDQPNTRFSIRTVDGQPRVASIDGRPLTDPDLADRFRFRFSGDPGAGRGKFAYEENGEPDLLLRNDGTGHFQPVPFTGGDFLDAAGRPLTQAPLDWGLSVMFHDLDGDGAPDLYVCNDFASPDRVWMNDGGGRFREAPALAFRQSPLSSMGVDVGDVNRDGVPDVFVVDMLSRDHARRFSQNFEMRPELLPVGVSTNRPQSPRNMLYVGRGDGTWLECARFSGLEAAEWAWTPIFLDVDLDGYEDVLVANGFERDNFNMDTLRQVEAQKKEKPLSALEQLQLRRQFPRLVTANLAFRNLGNLRFAEVSRAWGFDLQAISQGMCLADLDNDGALDVVLNNLNAPAALYRNHAGAPRLAVRLAGRAPNTRGIGARITLRPLPAAAGAGSSPLLPVQSAEIIAGGRYLSSDDALRVFAAGGADARFQLEVAWRSGRTSVLRGVEPGRLYEIREPAAAGTPGPAGTAPAPVSPLFQDVSALLGHVHHEESFPDFQGQPTIPLRFSLLGPGVAWGDLDGDGLDDLMVANGKGGRAALRLNRGTNGFVAPELTGALSETLPADETAVLFLPRTAGPPVLLAGQEKFRVETSDTALLRRYDFADGGLRGGTAAGLFSNLPPSTGPLALADVNGDGMLDLFVGGRVLPGRYPAAAPSFLFTNHHGRFEPDLVNNRTLTNAGLVSGATWSDLDGDGDPDLILAVQWGPVQIWRNASGRLERWNPSLRTSRLSNAEPASVVTLADWTGWWNGVATGDFDGDGRPDIVASNWGENTAAQPFRARPLRVFYGGTTDGGPFVAVEGYEEAATGRLLPLQSFLQMGMVLPEMRERLGRFATYATLALPEIHAPLWDRWAQLQAAHLESTLFLNRGDHFQAVPLPPEAQLAPAFAVVVGDFDGDGAEDLFLSQNFYSLPAEVSRYDAGRGLWLAGDGRGGFRAASGDESGLKIYGEQRGAAAADYDGDGRTDLVVTQNGAETKLFRNTGGRPGLRVRLAGPAGNPTAIGATVRLVTEAGLGLAREIRAGSGYWSQDSAVTVLHPPAGRVATAVQVIWPDRHVTTTPLSPAVRLPTLPGAHGIVIHASGEGQVVR